METIAVTLLLKALPIALPLFLTWIGARWDQLVRSRVKNEKLRTILLHVDDAVATAVKAVQQTYLDALESALKDDGKLLTFEKQQALTLAVATAKAQLPPDILAVLESMFGDKLDAFLTTKVEAAVRDLKKPTGRNIKLEAFAVPGLSRATN